MLSMISMMIIIFSQGWTWTYMGDLGTQSNVGEVNLLPKKHTWSKRVDPTERNASSLLRAYGVESKGRLENLDSSIRFGAVF